MSSETAWPRRKVLAALASVGAGSAVFGRAVVTLAEGKDKLTPGMIEKAEWISGVKYSSADRKMMLEGVNEALADYAKIRTVRIDNSVPPALWFHPAPGTATLPSSPPAGPSWPENPAVSRPSTEDDLAFAPVTTLAPLLRSRKVSATELTKIYLDRLHRFDPSLLCVVSYTEEMALDQAAGADREIASGRYRGPLHGIPWAAKDLIAVPGYPTTWGSVPYKSQVRPETATVASLLQQAGAVLVAKTSVGELAWGDVWYGGMTRNPWKLEEGSSGSSAGSASAAAAGLVGFAIGTETLGSIVSPCTRCGASGLRPTFGRVSRHGAMALCWSMDKIGPIARSIEDCALVFAAIHGADPHDPSAVDRPFEWPSPRDIRSLRIGYVPALFDEDRTRFGETDAEKQGLRDWQANDQRALDTLRQLGVQLVEIKLPQDPSAGSISFILVAEAAASFDELTRDGRDDTLVRQVADAWPNVFRQGQLIPAVEYIRANRIRTLLMRDMQKVMADVDLYVTPSYGGGNLTLTNLTGHPSVVMPDGFRSTDGTPTSITFTGRLYGESELLSAAAAWQNATDYHQKRPPLVAPPRG